VTRSIRPTPEKRAQLVARRLSWERYHDEDLRLLAAEIRAAEERACAEVIDALEELIGTQALLRWQLVALRVMVRLLEREERLTPRESADFARVLEA